MSGIIAHVASVARYVRDVDFDVLFRFFCESLDAGSNGSTDTNLAIANSVIWACALDEALADSGGEQYAEARDAHSNGRTLIGLRLARNGILHGQAFAVQPQGMAYPLEYPLFFGPPVWKSYAELTRTWMPQAKGQALDRLREAYEVEMAGKNVAAPLWTTRDWFAGVRESRWMIERHE